MTPTWPPGPGFWLSLTRLGEAQILLPVMLALLGWLAWRGRHSRLALAWLLSTGLAALITTASKLAFIGYGIGWAAADFTGFSGHAMFAAAILPPLCGLAAAGRAGLARWGVLLGCALAGVVALSRVAVQAHSWSETLLGLALGLAASALTLRLAQPLPALGWAPRHLAGVLAAWALLAVSAAPPSRTHDWVTRLALAQSGRSQPYKRWQMHRDHRLAQQARLGAAAVGARPAPPPVSGPRQ